MNTVAETEFFAPSTTSPLEYLLQDYEHDAERLREISNFMMAGDNRDYAKSFIEGFGKRNHSRIFTDTSQMFELSNAVPALNARYWNKAMAITDVLDFMPSKRRDEWTNSIHELKTPDFKRETVLETMKTLMSQRMDFLAEMVDGIFTGLSGEHVTNRPEGFGKRMIINCVCDSYSDYGSRKQGLIHDMRCVIAKFMGRESNPVYASTRKLINVCQYDTGTWFNVDGNAFRIRVYKKGTAHIEINQDIAYRLNQILAYLHPMAIPAPHRKRPNKKAPKDFALIERPLPFEVLDILGQLKVEGTKVHHKINTIDRHVSSEVAEILEAIGGVKGEFCHVFDYNVESVIRNILTSGVMPDRKTHQFYPTSESLAEILVGIADIQQHDSVLEPSAGHGALIAEVPKHAAYIEACEVSRLHIDILNATSFSCEAVKVHCCDFLQFQTDTRYNKIIMNPPFSQGRALAHVEHAASLLKEGGRLVAILPASFKGKEISGMNCKYHGIHENMFAHTSVKVTILEINK